MPTFTDHYPYWSKNGERSTVIWMHIPACLCLLWMVVVVTRSWQSFFWPWRMIPVAFVYVCGDSFCVDVTLHTKLESYEIQQLKGHECKCRCSIKTLREPVGTVGESWFTQLMMHVNCFPFLPLIQYLYLNSGKPCFTLPAWPTTPLGSTWWVNSIHIVNDVQQ